MRFGLRILLLWLSGFGLGFADTVQLYTPTPPGWPPAGWPPAGSPGLACGEAGRAAEQAASLPANLLVSIGLVESGRMDPASGRVASWPWTVNVDGAGHYFASEQDAAAFAEQAESAGARDVDVGCFQISLENHPFAFTSLDAAFDPAGNANFAAHFLNGLKAQSGTWESAIADYHSAWPEFGVPYQHRVFTAWQDLGGAPPDIASAPAMLPDLSVILEAPEAREVRVITMDVAPQQAVPLSGPPRQEWLPLVITP